MKPLALIAAVAAVAFLVARKTGLISRDQVKDLADQANSMTQHAAEAAKSAVENAAQHASDVIPKHS